MYLMEKTEFPFFFCFPYFQLLPLHDDALGRKQQERWTGFHDKTVFTPRPLLCFLENAAIRFPALANSLCTKIFLRWSMQQTSV